ncbi:MAG TPA: adenylate/guanylate cyclase domain-containing protein [Stellaceae bacterium]|nr:adenylate/guanylate cyclase domain-containing protein [Stellaceae bacterium]
MKRFLSVFRRGVVYWLPLAVLLAATTAHLVSPELFNRLSLFAFDKYQQLAPRQASPDFPVQIVDIDEHSLKQLGQWPWPRTTLARMLDKLAEAGAAVVAFDVLFTEPDRTSPEMLRSLLTEQGAGAAEAAQVLASMPDPDAALAKAMTKVPVVVGFNLTASSGRGNPLAKAGFAVLGAKAEDPWRYVDSFPEAVAALPELQKSAAGNGFVNEPSDWDNIVRHVPLVFRLANKPVPSLAAEAMRVGFGGRGYLVRYAGAQAEQSFGENSGLNAVEIPVPAAHTAIRVPVNRAGQVTVYYARRDPRRYISAADIVAGKFAPERIADHIVLVGSSAAGLNDLKATPIAPDMPGVEVHAQLIEQILERDFLFRPDWGPGAEIIFALLSGLLLIATVPRLGALLSAELALIAAIGAVVVSWLAFRNGSFLIDPNVLQGGHGHVLLDPVYPIAVLATVYLVSNLVNYRQTEQRQREIRQAFSLYLAPQLVEELAKNPEKLVLGGEIRLMTIMFCDIRGFTTLSEGMSSHDLGQLINEFLTPMTEIIMAHKGTIDKYIGDCIMAFWNAPLDDPDHAKNAVAAAQEMRRKLVELNAAWAAEGRRSLHVGIGINTGECSVGNFGSHQKFNYSLLGDPVNLASRLEGLTKLYGVDEIIGEETAELLDEPGLIELDLVAVKGKTRAVRIFTLPPHPVEAQQYLARHAALLDAYRRRDWDAALGLLEDPVLAAEGEMAPVYGLFRERIAQLRVDSPPSDWDGVFVAHEK